MILHNRQSLPQIVTSCVVIKHKLSLTKVGDFSGKKGIGISPDPLGGGVYSLQSISATPREVCKDKTNLVEQNLMQAGGYYCYMVDKAYDCSIRVS